MRKVFLAAAVAVVAATSAHAGGMNAVVQQPNVAYNAYLGERMTFGITLTARY